MRPLDNTLRLQAALICEQEQYRALPIAIVLQSTVLTVPPTQVGVLVLSRVSESDQPQLCRGEGRDNTRSRLQHLLLVVVWRVVDQRCQHERLIKIERF